MATTLPPLPGPYAASLPGLSRQEVANQTYTPSHEELLRPIGSGPQYSADYTQKVLSGQVAVPGAMDQATWQKVNLGDEWTSTTQNALRQSGTYQQLYAKPYFGPTEAEQWLRDEYNRKVGDQYAIYKQQQLDQFRNLAADQASLAGLDNGSFAAGGNPHMSAAAQQYQMLVDESKGVANRTEQMMADAQARMDTMPGAWGEREQNLTSYLQGLGQSQRDELARQEAAAQSGLQQDMINRGMISTSVLDSLRGGLRSNFGQQRTSLEDTLTREKMDYMKALTGETLEANERAIGGARDTARQVFEMQQSPLAARQAYADALAKQREYDLGMVNQLNAERLQAALGYAQLRSQEGQAAQQRVMDRNKLLSDQYINYSGLVGNLHLQNMQTAAGLAGNTSMPYYNYQLMYQA